MPASPAITAGRLRRNSMSKKKPHYEARKPLHFSTSFEIWFWDGNSWIYQGEMVDGDKLVEFLNGEHWHERVKVM